MRHFGHEDLSPTQLELAGENFTSTKKMFSTLLPQNQLEAALEYYFNHFLSRELPPQAVLPGAHELLDLVKNIFKLPIIGITNSEQFIAKKILRDLNLFDKFDYVIGIKDSHLPKPDPQMLLAALDAIKAKPGKHVWFVGDRLSDTQCAQQVNCTAIRFYHKIKPQDQYADLFVNSHYQLFDIIKAKLGC